MRFWSRRDPRAKTFFALLVSFTVAMTTWVTSAMLFPVVAILFLSLLPGWSRFLGLFQGVLVLWGLSLLANAFLVDGHRLGPEALGVLRPTREGVVMGLGQGARLGVLVAVSSWLAASTSVLDLAGSLEWTVRKSPRLRQAVHRVLLPLVLALRLLPAFRDEATRLREVDRLRRGSDTPSGVRHLARLAPTWVAMVIERSEALAQALTLRGYRAGGPRGFARGYRFAVMDWLLVLGGLGSVALGAIT